MVEWTEDSYLVGGLNTTCCFNAPRVYLHNGTFKIIIGKSDSLSAWYWGGSSWISDPSILTGFSGYGTNTCPAIFFSGSILTIIAGEFAGGFRGWYWNGSSWISDPSIVAGLIDKGSYSSPTVFNDGSILILISDVSLGAIAGWYKSDKIAVGDTILLIPNYGDTYDRAAIKGGDISVGDNVNLYPLKSGAKVAIKEEWSAGDKIIF